MSVNISMHDSDTGGITVQDTGIVFGQSGLFSCIHIKDAHSDQSFDFFSSQSQTLRLIGEAFLNAAKALDAEKDKQWAGAGK